MNLCINSSANERERAESGRQCESTGNSVGTILFEMRIVMLPRLPPNSQAKADFQVAETAGICLVALLAFLILLDS